MQWGCHSTSEELIHPCNFQPVKAHPGLLDLLTPAAGTGSSLEVFNQLNFMEVGQAAGGRQFGRKFPSTVPSSAYPGRARTEAWWKEMKRQSRGFTQMDLL